MAGERDQALGADGGHSLFAPSASAGWMTCPDYLLANRGKPDSAGEYAAEGTVFHTIMERMERSGGLPGVEQDDVIQVEAGGRTHDIAVTEEMLSHAAECWARNAGIAGDRYVETRVDFSDLTPLPDQGGTCDLAICTPGRLVIRDYKYGRGVAVDAEENPQLLLYAYGAFRMWNWLYGFEEVELGIMQPRLDRYPTWTIGRAELLAFAEKVRARAALAWRALTVEPVGRTPDPKACQWCRASAVCPGRAAYIEAIADASFEVHEGGGAIVPAAAMRDAGEALDAGLYAPRLVPAEELSTAQLSRLLTFRSDVEKWFAAIAEEVLRRALEGQDTPGWKVVEARTHRQWRDLEAAERFLVAAGLPVNDFYAMEPISVSAAAERLRRLRGISLKKAKEQLEAVAFKPPGRPTLARQGDSRAQALLPDDAFDAVDEGDL